MESGALKESAIYRLLNEGQPQKGDYIASLPARRAAHLDRILRNHWPRSRLLVSQARTETSCATSAAAPCQASGPRNVEVALDAQRAQ